MKTTFLTAAALAGLMIITGCACPHTKAYTGTPYESRTAGSGMVEEGCFRHLWE
jgi:hypothetical protein